MKFDWRIALVALTKVEARSAIGHKGVNIANERGWVPQGLQEDAIDCMSLELSEEDDGGSLIVKARVHGWKVDIWR